MTGQIGRTFSVTRELWILNLHIGSGSGGAAAAVRSVGATDSKQERALSARTAGASGSAQESKIALVFSVIEGNLNGVGLDGVSAVAAVAALSSGGTAAIATAPVSTISAVSAAYGRVCAADNVQLSVAFDGRAGVRSVSTGAAVTNLECAEAFAVRTACSLRSLQIDGGPMENQVQIVGAGSENGLGIGKAYIGEHQRVGGISLTNLDCHIGIGRTVTGNLALTRLASEYEMVADAAIQSKPLEVQGHGRRGVIKESDGISVFNDLASVIEIIVGVVYTTLLRITHGAGPSVIGIRVIGHRGNRLRGDHRGAYGAM